VTGNGSDSSTALRASVASGVRWGFLVSIATQAGRIVFLVVLMRLLGPRNVGIVGQAAIFIAMSQIFLHLGVGVSIVQRPRLDRDEVGSAFWLTVVIGLTLAALTVVAAPLLAAFFGTEELTAVVRVLAISFVLKGFTVVPTALLTRNMRFGDLGKVEVTSTFLSGLLSVGAATMGASYWALVIQTVSLEAIYLILILWIGGLPELAWSSRAARRLWSFSSRVLGADLVNYVSDNGDKVLVAKFLGPTQLALYSLAFRVLQLTLQMLAQAGRVVLPTFSRLQDDRDRLARAFLNVTESVALALFPAMTLIILSAPSVVPALLGEAWADAIVPLQLVAAITILYVLGAFMGPLTIAVGRADWEFRWSVVTMVVALASFAFGLQWGIVGVAAAYLIMLSVLNPIRFMVIQRLVPISAGRYLLAWAPALTCSVALCVVWLLTDAVLQNAMSGPVLAVVASVTGTAAYVVTVRVVWPANFRRQLEFARLVARGGRR
jgi:PST family polysaccharide transporter